MEEMGPFLRHIESSGNKTCSLQKYSPTVLEYICCSGVYIYCSGKYSPNILSIYFSHERTLSMSWSIHIFQENTPQFP